MNYLNKSMAIICSLFNWNSFSNTTIIDYIPNYHRFLRYYVFFIFIIVQVLFLNLLTGVAVEDVDKMLKDSKDRQHIRQVWYYARIAAVLLGWVNAWAANILGKLLLEKSEGIDKVDMHEVELYLFDNKQLVSFLIQWERQKLSIFFIFEDSGPFSSPVLAETSCICC